MIRYRTTREIRVPEGTEVEVDPADTSREYSKETVVLNIDISELPSRAELVLDLEDALAAKVIEEIPDDDDLEAEDAGDEDEEDDENK
jgi:hypothetical protein